MQSSLLTRPGNALNPGGRAAAPNASALPIPPHHLHLAQPHSPSPKPHLAPTATPHTCQAVRGRRGHAAAAAGSGAAAVLPEAEVQGMPQWLDSLKYSADGLVAVIVQHVDTGEVLMQAYADKAALNETLQTRLATFYSRSRKERWCKGETSGAYIHVQGVFADCDRDSLIYLGDPIGPSCHTGARTCWFSETSLGSEGVHEAGAHARHAEHAPHSTLLALERTIAQRKAAMQQPSEGKPSWTARLLVNPELTCKKVREEAGELCQTLEASEGKERAASEMADLLYHAMVLLNLQGVTMEEVLRELRRREGVSGVEEKAARPPKPAA